MALTQFFDTTVFIREEDVSFRYLVLPTRCLSPENRSYILAKDRNIWGGNLPPFAADLGFLQGRVFSDQEILDYEWLWPDLLEATRFSDGSQALKYIEDVKSKTKQPLSETNPALAQKVKLFWDQPIVPFEESPLELSSLKDIVVSGSGVAIGATLGFVVAAGTPFLWLTVPAGMVICGGAAGIAKGLEQGLQSWVLSLLGVNKV